MRTTWAVALAAAVLAATTLAACEPATTTSTLTAVADAYVDADVPTTSFGTVSPVVVDASPQREILLRFDLSGLKNTVTNARLRLHVANVTNAGSPEGGTVSKVSDTTWTEAVTWSTRPTAWGAPGGELGTVAADSWVEITLTNLVKAGTPLTLGLRSTNTDGAYFDSREAGAFAPQLVVTTGPAPAAVTGTTIGAVGDLVCAPGGAVTATTCHQRSVSDWMVLDSSMASFLALGDLQYEAGELSSFETAYQSTYGRLKAKTRPVIGNHEYGTSGAAGYFSYFGAAAGDPTKGYYSFDVGESWHVVVLNSNCSIVSCAAGSAQEQWLRADLAASSRPCIAAAWHHPRFTSSTSHSSDPALVPFWTALQEKGADLVLSGHVHNYERFAPQMADGTASAAGIREIVVGTGGKSQYAFAAAQPNSQVRMRAFGYLKLRLGASSYGWQLVDDTGAVRDSGSAACH